MNKNEQDGIRKPRFQKTNFENFLFTLIHSYASLFTAVHCYSLLLPRRKVPRSQDIMMSPECRYI